MLGTLPYSSQGLLLLLIDAFILAVVILKPMTRNYDDSDRGSGSLVLMTPPLRPSYVRCAAFLIISFVVSSVIVGLRSPNLVSGYHSAVAALLQSVVRDPTSVRAYATSLLPVFQVSVVAFGVAFAVAFRASLARRVVILINICIFVVASVVIDAVFGVVALATHLPIGPTPLVDVVVQYLFAGVMLVRLGFTSFQLPKKTSLPLLRGFDWKPDLILVTCLVVAIVEVAAGATYAVSRWGHDPLIASMIVFACPPYLFLLVTVNLGLVRLVRPRRVNPTAERPPIEVIIPAFNEEINIARLLTSIDVAAERYAGPVRVLLCDDGSLDNTIPIAEECMARFEHATGEIIFGDHRGKSAALNQALAQCTSDFVFRIDADCVAHPNCFLYSVPYFLADQRVGLVGAFTLPKEPYTTWIDRMRLYELVVLFGFVRPASDVVDGIYCVPGTFTGFRRTAGLEAGGFVDGMYGEDVEFTYALARLGYRAVIDTRIASYEDVPNTQRQLRVQRVRWNRGGTMAFARYVPVVTGLSGPRMWFFASRQQIRRFLMPFRLTLLTFILAEALFRPSVHTNLIRLGVILVFRLVPSVLQTVVCTAYYRKAKELVWLPLQYVFVLLKHYYALEHFLSFNARPVVTPRIAEALRPATRRLPVDPAEA